MTVALSKLNFRDLGGLPTVDGRRTRSGVIYRSEGPASFLAEHRVELVALGLRTVCDLRAAVERDAAPNDWCGPGCRVLHLDMNTDLRAMGADGWKSLRTDPTGENARSAIIANYRSMPAALAPHLSGLVDVLLAGEVPMLLHCTAGKDRTGVAVAVLLSLLGVARETILADYVRSSVFGDSMRLSGSVAAAFRHSLGFEPSAAVMDVMLGVHAEFLLAALEAIERDWGSVAAYCAASGVDARRQAALCDVLVA